MKKFLMTSLAATILAGASASAGVLSPGLQSWLQGQADDAVVKVMLAMETDLSITELDAKLHQDNTPLDQRHQLVIKTLQDDAQRVQSTLIPHLDKLQAEGRVKGYTPHWISNVIIVTADVETVRELARRPEVEQAEMDLKVTMIDPVPSEDPKMGTRDSREIGITPGVEAIQADRVWYELGIWGNGALVANLDTGVDANHPALDNQWRGNYAPVSECWLDQIGAGASFPVDNHGHGSHTMGTICGIAPNDTIGVCPGAQWIAANAIDQGTGSAFDNDIIQAFEWFADPDGNAATLDDVPDVVQNSWGVNEGFSGYYDCDSRWWDAIDGCEAAGVVVTWSAGNEGPGGTSLRSPADRATTPTNCFSVGATDATAPYTIASFSSRGPSGCGGQYAMKPEVSAPGVDIYSVDHNTTGYTYMSGTSMAGPHVAGVVGLMRAANPNADVITIKEVLMATCTDLGTTGEDNVYGHGFVNAYEAVLAVMSGYGTVSGTITDQSTGLPIEGARVENTAGSQETTSNGDGDYQMFLPADTYTLTYSAFGYQAETASVTVFDDEDTVQDMILYPSSTALLYGYVYDPDSAPVVGATITFDNAPLPDVISGAGGYYEVDLPMGYTYDLTCSAAGLGEATTSLTFDAGQRYDFNLPVDPRYLPTGPDTYGYYIFDDNDSGSYPYEWNDITGTGTAHSLGDDASTTVTVPFAYNFYGTTYTQLSISSNGFVTPGSSGNTAFSNTSIPGTGTPNGSVYPLWDDLNPSSGGTIHTQLVNGNMFVVQYTDVPYYGGGGSVSFQVVILDPVDYPTPTNDAAWLVFYNTGDRASSTVGLENSAGTDGLQYVYNGSYDEHASALEAGRSLLITTDPAGMGTGEDTTPPIVQHVALTDTDDSAGPWTVLATISDYSGVQTASVNYRFNGGSWNTVTMGHTGDDYSADIPGPAAVGTEIEYSIAATDASDNHNSGTEGPWTFTILGPQGLEYCQDFETGLDDFTVVNMGSGNEWILSNYSGQGNTAYVSYTSSTTETWSYLVSPTFDCSDQVTVELSFWHHLLMGYDGYWSNAYVKGSVDGGANWDYLLAEWHSDDQPGEFTVEGTEVLDITSWAAGEADVAIMFEYHDLYDWYWYVDDICLSGTLGVEPIPVVIDIELSTPNQVTISWDAVEGADSYVVYHSGEPYGPWSELGSTASTSYDHTISGDRGFYQVTASTEPPAAVTEIPMIDPSRLRKTVNAHTKPE